MRRGEQRLFPLVHAGAYPGGARSPRAPDRRVVRVGHGGSITAQSMLEHGLRRLEISQPAHQGV